LAPAKGSLRDDRGSGVDRVFLWFLPVRIGPDHVLCGCLSDPTGRGSVIL